MKTPRTLLLGVAASAALVVAPTSARAQQQVVGAVYTMTNDAAGNQVLQYDRLPDGGLQYAGAYATGGLGSGDGLGNQGGVVLSDDGRWLLVVNAGSDDVSVFGLKQNTLALRDREPTGGVRPVSVAVHKDLVYVVHAGGSVTSIDSVSALRLDGSGDLTPLAGSSVALSGPDTAPAQVGFSPDGRFVLVTEKATDTIAVFPLDKRGYAGPGVFNAASGVTPFAFAFCRCGTVVVSEAFGGMPGAGAVSSYEVMGDGTLLTVSGSVTNTQTAPCWLVVTKGGHYAFTANTPDDSLSAYGIEADGHLQLLDPDGRAGEPGAGTRPLDIALSDDGRFLYTLNIGDHTLGSFRVGPKGKLRLVSATPGLPAGVNGLAAR